MELFQIRYFFHAASRGGLAPAAAFLHVSMPAVSKAIAKLEDELGCQLFAREGRSLVLTEVGRHFLVRAEEILTRVEQTMTEMRGPTAIPELVIAGREVLLEHFGIAVAAKFRTRHPDAPVVLKSLSDKDALSIVESGGAHLAITLQTPPPAWTSKRVGDVRFVTAVGRRHPLHARAKAKEEIPVKEVCSYGFVSPNLPLFGRIGAQQSIDGWRDDVHPRKISFVVESLSIYARLLQEGRGAGYMPDFLAKQLELTELKVSDCSFQVRQKVRLTARRARDLSWLGQLVDDVAKAADLSQKL